MFRYCLEDFSPNRWRWGDSRKVAEVVGARPERQTCPHGAKDNLGLILIGYKDEPRNFFYSLCEMRLSHWILTVSSYEESGAHNNLITAPSNLGIIGGASIARGSGSDSEETTSLSREIYEVIDLQASLRDMCKKRRTDVGP